MLRSLESGFAYLHVTVLYEAILPGSHQMHALLDARVGQPEPCAWGDPGNRPSIRVFTLDVSP